MTMPTFDPVALRSAVLERVNKLAANSNFHLQGFEAHKLGNLVQAIFEAVAGQLTDANEMTTDREQILALAGGCKLIGKACGEWSMPNSVLPEAFEAFYHASRKPLLDALEAKERENAELKAVAANLDAALADATEWNWLDEDAPKEVLGQIELARDAYKALIGDKP